jgi:ATP adenylyltransferase
LIPPIDSPAGTIAGRFAFGAAAPEAIAASVTNSKNRFTCWMLRPPVYECRLARVPKPLWAPWRLEYIAQADEQEGCVFCEAAAGDDQEKLVVHRGERAFVVLNKFPYSSGHLMVAPYRHVGEFGDLTDEEALEVHRLAERGLAALAETYRPQGYNLGWNLGRIAGAGVVDHVHLHVVPRWAGDTNFMPVLADVKVLPEHLAETRRRLGEAWVT